MYLKVCRTIEFIGLKYLLNSYLRLELNVNVLIITILLNIFYNLPNKQFSNNFISIFYL